MDNGYIMLYVWHLKYYYSEIYVSYNLKYFVMQFKEHMWNVYVAMINYNRYILFKKKP